MKILFCLMLIPLLLIAGNERFVDRVELYDTSEYMCRISLFKKDSVEIFNKKNMLLKFSLKKINNIKISEKGEVFNVKYGYIFNIKYLNILLGERKDKKLKPVIASSDTLDIAYSPANYRPGDHELFIMPTAFTMEKGSAYFSDYELIFLNYTYALTNSTHISIFSMFPFSSEFMRTVTFGMKQNYLHEGNFHSALWGAFMPDAGLYSFGNVFTLGNQNINLNYSLGFGGMSDEEDMAITNMVGVSATINKDFSFIAEYANFGGLDDDDLFDMFTIGIRFRGKNIAWDFGGFKPLDSADDLFLLPLLKATYRFK